MVQDVGTVLIAFSPLTGVFSPWSSCVGVRASGPLTFPVAHPAQMQNKGIVSSYQSLNIALKCSLK